MSIIEERIAKVSELESVASNPANDAITRKIASNRIINLWHLIQSQQAQGKEQSDRPIVKDLAMAFKEAANERIFLMKDLAAVEEAVVQGAKI